MEQKKINSIFTVYNSLVDLLHNILIQTPIIKEEIFYSLFGVIVLDLIINKETMVKNKEGIIYESLMSDDQLENILLYLDIENIDKDNNGASIYATIRNKLAHGDYYLDNNYIVFNINNKECKILLKHFVYYYIVLTDKLKCRFKENKFLRHHLVDKSIGKFHKILRTRNDILEYLKYLSYKEFIFKRNDNKELTSKEKTDFITILVSLYKQYNTNEKMCEAELKKIYNNEIYRIDIKTKKLKKLDESKLLEIEKIIDKYNNMYEFDDEAIDTILYKSTEDIYKLIENNYEHYSIQYGLSNIKTILNEMIKNDIYDFSSYVETKVKNDSFYFVGLPINEIIVSIILSLIYFNYCYPLEKIYKENKMFDMQLGTNFDFSKLNLEELDPTINKLYNLGKDNLINEEQIKLNSYKKKFIEYSNVLDKKVSQRKNLIKSYMECNDSKTKQIIDKLTNDINTIYSDFEYYLHLFNNQKLILEELNKWFENKDMNFYNYTVINGIRNAISHGNVSCKNIATAELKDVEVEFVDIYNNEIQFKLNIKLDNLFSLIEQENITRTNMYLKRKINQ